MIHLARLAAFLIVLGVIVLIHELGHYIAARLTGVRVDVFSFGFGKRLFGKKIGATDFRVSLIPLGGYVRMAGEEEYDPANLKPDEFMAKNRAQKIFILVMGAAMNIFLSLVLLTITQMSGVEVENYKLEKPVIGYVKGGSAGEAAGIRRGDHILAINGKSVSNWKDLDYAVGTSPKEKLRIDFQRNGSMQSTTLQVASIGDYDIGYAGLFPALAVRIEEVSDGQPAAKAGIRKGDTIQAVNGAAVDYFQFQDMIERAVGKSLRFTVTRNGSIFDLAVIPAAQADGKGKIGVLPHFPTTVVSKPLGEAMRSSVSEAIKLAGLTIKAFRKMFTFRLSPKNLSGPLEIAKFSQNAMQNGLTSFLVLLAFISLQLGLVNLFPIPGLDGGHLMITSIEAVIRRDLSMKLKNILIYVGFSLLIALMVFVVLNDIAKTLPNGWKSILPFL